MGKSHFNIFGSYGVDPSDPFSRWNRWYNSPGLLRSVYQRRHGWMEEIRTTSPNQLEMSRVVALYRVLICQHYNKPAFISHLTHVQIYIRTWIISENKPKEPFYTTRGMFSPWGFCSLRQNLWMIWSSYSIYLERVIDRLGFWAGWALPCVVLRRSTVEVRGFKYLFNIALKSLHWNRGCRHSQMVRACTQMFRALHRTVGSISARVRSAIVRYYSWLGLKMHKIYAWYFHLQNLQYLITAFTWTTGLAKAASRRGMKIPSSKHTLQLR